MKILMLKNPVHILKKHLEVNKREYLKTVNELPSQEMLLPLKPEKRDGN